MQMPDVDKLIAKSQFNKWMFYAAALLVAALLILSRRPDAILQPQLYAEDGTIFFADAYNLGGIAPFFKPYAGYLHFVPRLIAFLAVPFGVTAPIIITISALLFQLCTFFYILSPRLVTFIPNTGLRIYLAFLYIGLPSMGEIYLNVANTQWHLALLACLILISSETKSRSWKIFEFLILLCSGLSGPFCVLLLPVAFLVWFYRRNPTTLVRLGLLLVCACLQLSVLSQELGQSRKVSIIFDPILLAQILNIQVLISGITGHAPISLLFKVSSLSSLTTELLLLAVFLSAIALCFYCFCVWKGPFELKILLIFGGLCFVAGLLTTPWWLLCNPGWAMRYWLIPRVAYTAALFWCASLSQFSWLWRTARLLLVIQALAVIVNWPQRAFPESNFAQQFQTFSQLPTGTSMSFRVYPTEWEGNPMILRKK